MGKLVLADLVDNMRRHPGGRSSIGGELDALEARAKLRHATPNVFSVSHRIGREAVGQDTLKPRFAGSAVLQVMVAVQLAHDGWRVV